MSVEAEAGKVVAGEEDGPPAAKFPGKFPSAKRRQRPGVEQAPPMAGGQERGALGHLRFSRQGLTTTTTTSDDVFFILHSSATDKFDNECLLLLQYLGCVEVFESRGMQVCEEALKVLRVSNCRIIAYIVDY